MCCASKEGVPQRQREQGGCRTGSREWEPWLTECVRGLGGKADVATVPKEGNCLKQWPRGVGRERKEGKGQLAYVTPGTASKLESTINFDWSVNPSVQAYGEGGEKGEEGTMSDHPETCTSVPIFSTCFFSLSSFYRYQFSPTLQFLF